MTLPTAMLAILIVILGIAQYALCVQALRDLARRPRVRGDNKALWGFGILCLPFAGAIVYNWMGPTSFINRQGALTDSPSGSHGREPAILHPSPANVTPISAARSVRQRRANTDGASRAPGRARPGRTGS